MPACDCPRGSHCHAGFMGVWWVTSHRRVPHSEGPTRGAEGSVVTILTFVMIPSKNLRSLSGVCQDSGTLADGVLPAVTAHVPGTDSGPPSPHGSCDGILCLGDQLLSL